MPPSLSKVLTRALPLVLLIAGIFLFGCTTHGLRTAWTPSPAETRLVELMAERLQIAREVAWIKYQDGRPILAPEREKSILASVSEQGTELGLPAARAQEFFQAQMSASRAMQQRLVRSWSRGNPLPTWAHRSLTHDIRPRLDAIGSEILTLLTHIPPAKNPSLRRYAENTLVQQGIPRSIAARAAAPL